MQYIHNKHNDAITTCLNSHTYSVYYSESKNSDLSIHVHDCCELLLCLSGGNSFLIDGRAYDVNDGDLFILNQFEPHKITADRESIFARFVIQIHPEYLFANSTSETDLSRCFYTRGANMSHRISLSDKEISELQKLLIMFRSDHGFGDDVVKNSSMNTILALVNQFFLKHAEGVSITKCENEILKNIINYVNVHYNEALTLESLAKNNFVSVNQLCKIFKNNFGTTVAKYIVSKRISEAKKLLASGKSVSDTAVLCGFPDYANFIRVFKKFVGVSPGKYKKS